MHINNRLGAEGIVGLSDNPEKIIRSNTSGPSTLPVAAEAGDNRPTGRDEKMTFEISSIAEVFADTAADKKVSEMTAV